MRSISLTQALNISGHGLHVSIRHLRCDGAHHLGAIVGARAETEIVQLGVDVVAVLAGQARELDGNALALRAVAGGAGRNAGTLDPAAEDLLADQGQLLILGSARLGLLGAEIGCQVQHVLRAETGDDAAHHRILAVTRLEVGELFVDVFRIQSGQPGVGRNGAVAIRRVAARTDLIDDAFSRLGIAFAGRGRSRFGGKSGGGGQSGDQTDDEFHQKLLKLAKLGKTGSLAATNMTAKPVLNCAQFHTSVAQLRDLPYSRAEIAFAGRSNAGKSSAINLLTRKNRLAFTSKTPGRTQLINFFELDADTYLVDLPGYGYAKVPPEVKAKWEGLLSRYLQEREALVGMVLIMDARHPLTPLDRQMLDWFAPTGKPVHILLSKADKLSNSEKALTLRRVKQELAALEGVTVQLFSSLSRAGAEEAAALVEGWLVRAQQAHPHTAGQLQ